MSFIRSVMLVVVGIGIAWAISLVQPKQTVLSAVNKPTDFNRVMESKTIRCGWVNYQPATYKDPNTGEMHGIFVEAMEQIGKQLDLKIDWTYETTWATFMEDLRQNKFDVVCTAAWMLSAAELNQGEFTTPLYYSQIGAWVKTGNERFDNNLAAFNSPNTTIAGIDGSYALNLAKKKFPQAKVFSSTSTAEYITGLTNVAFGKADVTFVENWLAAGYVQKNPGTLRQVPLPEFLDTRPNVMMVRKGEFELQSVLNYALFNLQLTGDMETILAKYENTPGNFKRVRY